MKTYQLAHLEGTWRMRACNWLARVFGFGGVVHRAALEFTLDEHVQLEPRNLWAPGVGCIRECYVCRGAVLGGPTLCVSCSKTGEWS